MMKLELRSLKCVEKLSEETPCYTANLYVDGEKTAEVSNAGHGGPDSVLWLKPDAEKAVTDHFAAMPPFEYQGIQLNRTLEIWCHEQVETIKSTKELKRLLNKKVLMVEGGELFSGAMSVEDAKSKHPNAVILNELPFDEALRLFMGEDDGWKPETDETAEFTEATEEELAQQETRKKPEEPVEELDEEARQAEIERVKTTLEQPVDGETPAEKTARIERNNQKLAAVDPKLKALLEHVREKAAKDERDRADDVHPGSRIKSPSAAAEKKSAAEPKAKKNTAGLSLKERLQAEGIKPVKSERRRQVAEMIVNSKGVSVADLAAKTGATPHDIGNDIYYLQWQNGYVFDSRKDGKTKLYTGRAPTEEEVAASHAQPKGEDEAAA